MELVDRTIVSAPASEPVITQEAKNWMKVDYSDDDTIISNLITSSRRWVEKYLSRSLITQTIQEVYQDFNWKVPLMSPPVQSIESVELKSRGDTSTLTVNDDYYVEGVQDKFIRLAAYNTLFWQSWSFVSDVHLYIKYKAGYGSASDVPEEIKQAILELTATNYDFRHSHTSTKFASGLVQVPVNLKAKLAPMKRVRL